jgi:hypothetical protein
MVVLPIKLRVWCLVPPVCHVLIGVYFFRPTPGADSDAPAVLPNKCNRTTFKYPRNLTMEEILTIEGFEVARNLLSYRTVCVATLRPETLFRTAPKSLCCIVEE